LSFAPPSFAAIAALFSDTSPLYNNNNNNNNNNTA